jgi:hypothetical protein
MNKGGIPEVLPKINSLTLHKGGAVLVCPFVIIPGIDFVTSGFPALVQPVQP